MELDTCTKVAPHDNALFTQLDDGQGVLLNLQSHAYFSLNRTATRIWQLIVDGVTFDEICRRLADEFDAGAPELEPAVTKFAQELLDANLVQLTD